MDIDYIIFDTRRLDVIDIGRVRAVLAELFCSGRIGAQYVLRF